jgi:hypothetical protein
MTCSRKTFNRFNYLAFSGPTGIEITSNLREYLRIRPEIRRDWQVRVQGNALLFA